MKIEVRPIESKRWHGKSGKESFTRPKKIVALVNPETFEYSVAMTSEELKDYSKKLNKNLSLQFDPESPHEFWDSSLGTIKLENATMILDTSKPLDFVHVGILKASKYIANSQKEYEEGLFPDATHIIFDESEEVEVKAKKIAIEKRATSESAKLSTTKKIEVLMIMAGKNCKGKSEDFIEVELDKVMKANPEEFLRVLDQDTKHITTQALIIECIDKSILRQKGHKIYYHDSVLGGDIEDVIEYLNKDENQSLKLRLMDAIKD